MRTFALLLLVVLLSTMGFAYVRITNASADHEYLVYIVERGDTLWDIALQFAPKNMDVREYVYNLRQLNNLKQSVVIHPGQELRLPSH